MDGSFQTIVVYHQIAVQLPLVHTAMATWSQNSKDNENGRRMKDRERGNASVRWMKERKMGKGRSCRGLCKSRGDNNRIIGGRITVVKGKE